MTEREQIQRAMAVLHASDGCIQEAMRMAERQTKKDWRIGRRIAAAAAAAVLALALAAGAMAHFDLWGWIVSLHRDAETQRRSVAAQEAVEQFIFQTENASPEVVIDETVLDLENGYTYAFSVPEWEENAGKAYVQVDDTGRIVWLDLRALYPYPRPTDCPPEYVGTLFDMDFKNMEPIEGTQREVFYADRYLSETAYPDRDAFNERIQEPARTAIRFLHDEGYVAVSDADVDYLCFDLFNGGSAQVDVLMKNGDIYHIYLLPDDLTPTGFLLRTAEELDREGWRGHYDALFAAARAQALEDFHNALQAEAAANGVG